MQFYSSTWVKLQARGYGIKTRFINFRHAVYKFFMFFYTVTKHGFLCEKN
jgi:hypothetical protein